MSWLPQPDSFAVLAVDQQTANPESTLELYRSLLAIRRDRRLGAGALDLLDLGADIVAADITTQAGTTRVVVNLGAQGWPIRPRPICWPPVLLT